MPGLLDGIIGGIEAAGKAALDRVKSEVSAGIGTGRQAVIDGVLDATGASRLALASIPSDLKAIQDAATALNRWSYILDSLVRTQKTGSASYYGEVNSWRDGAGRIIYALNSSASMAAQLQGFINGGQEVPGAAARAYTTARDKALNDAEAANSAAIALKGRIESSAATEAAKGTPGLLSYVTAPVTGAAEFVTQTALPSVQAALPAFADWTKWATVGAVAVAAMYFLPRPKFARNPPRRRRR